MPNLATQKFKLIQLIQKLTQKMNLKIVITGATGMVGEGVLHECLNSDRVAQVVVINRRPCGVVHPKLREIILANIATIRTVVKELEDFDSCFYCLGTSSLGKKYRTYSVLTYTLTMQFARTLMIANLKISFCYISGAGADSTETSMIMWARVKGKTENDLLRINHRYIYIFRPGFLLPTPGLKNTKNIYKIFGWMYPLLVKMFPKLVCKLSELGVAMINTAVFLPEQRIFEVPDIVELAEVIEI